MSRFVYGILVALLLIGAADALQAQNHDADSSAVAETDTIGGNRFLAVPVIFFLPETRWGFGATGIYNFRFKDEPMTTRSSQVAPGFAYTLEKQLLLYMPFTLYWEEQQNYSYGEVGYYRYFYLFHGIGNDQPKDQEELYTVNFPRIQLNWVKQVDPAREGGLFLGGQYWFEHYAVDERAEGEQLITDSITGSGGGVTSGLGVVGVYDTRDFQFYPSKGWYVEAMLNQNHDFLGSDFRYLRFRVNASKYFGFKWKHTLALNAYADVLNGDPPFHQLGFLGGPKRLRGLYEGRFRDLNALLLQAEYRLPLIWRFKGALFGSVGSVAPKLSDYLESPVLRYTYGAGIRFLLNEEELVHIRLDAGFAPGVGSGFYITVGEAF